MQAYPLSSPAARNLNPSDTILSMAEGSGLAHGAGNLPEALGLYCGLLDLPGVFRPEHLHYERELRLLSQRGGALIKRLLVGDREHVAPIVGPTPKQPKNAGRRYTFSGHRAMSWSSERTVREGAVLSC